MMRKSAFRKEVEKEAREHPILVKKYGVKVAEQIARDHRRKKR